MIEEWEDRVGDDGLQQPVEPFKTPRWFKWTIAIAVVGCLAMGVFVFWPGR